MIVDLRNLEGASGTITAEDDVSFVDAFDETSEVRCQVELKYNQAGGSYYFHGDVHGQLETKCHRCLEPVEQPLEGDFDVVVRRSGDFDDAAEDADETDYVTVALNEHEVSFKEFIRESALVGVPMLVLCREDCRGLCPTCGANLNTTTCSCETSAPDRWDALRKLKTRENNS